MFYPGIRDLAVGEAQRFHAFQPAKKFEAGIRDMGRYEGEMLEAAEALEFERAAVLRDELRELKRMMNDECGVMSKSEKTIDKRK